MLFRSVAVAALAGVVLANEARPVLVKMSVPSLFRRDDQVGYTPEPVVCNDNGATCSEACGAGYEACASSDSAIHCFNKAKKEVCCPNASGSMLPSDQEFSKTLGLVLLTFMSRLLRGRHLLHPR